MRLKQTIKHLLGHIRCARNQIPLVAGQGVYIGKDVSIRGGKNIRLGNEVCIRPYVDLWCGGKSITIGNGSEIGERCRISIANQLAIGEKVLFSPDVYVTDCDHAYEDIHAPVMEQGIVQKNNCISIGDHSYIGIHAVIVGNVKIGKHVVIGANSVVTKDIPDYCVAVGMPAKVIKKYDFETKQWKTQI